MVEGRQHRAGDQPRLSRALRRRGEKHDRVRAVAAVIMKIMLDDPDMTEAEPVGLLGEVERFLEIRLGRFLLGPDIGKKLHAELHGCTPPNARRAGEGSIRYPTRHSGAPRTVQVAQERLSSFPVRRPGSPPRTGPWRRRRGRTG